MTMKTLKLNNKPVAFLDADSPTYEADMELAYETANMTALVFLKQGELNLQIV